MKLTIVQPAIEGLVDGEHRPRVYEGHLTEAQCAEIARQYGSGYPVCRLVSCAEHEEAAFYANFGNSEDVRIDDDGVVNEDDKGHLELWFYHAGQEPSLIELEVVEAVTSYEVQDPDDVPMGDEGRERYWGAFPDSPIPDARVWVLFNREPNDQDEAERVARAYFGE